MSPRTPRPADRDGPAGRHGRTYRGATQRERQQERRARLIDAAVEVFGTAGYRAGTVDRICAEAGLTKRYFYESFADSEALLLAVYQRVSDDLRARVLAGAESAGPGVEDLVRAALDTLFRAIEADPRLARIAFVEVLSVSPVVDHAYRTVNTALVEEILRLTGPAFDGRELSGAHPQLLATGLLGAIVFIAHQWILSGLDHPAETVVTSAHALVMAVVTGAALPLEAPRA
ncbi:TetR/AcrR family transcriptional regulator [Streptomyces sp. DSM 44917]|uniref:TetR/AcrR family transcriptional regulator n=1 Tax=Streptomyces boetiae TaxID=3075541 RepID=A0ABU2L3Q0_9ACTN|nr:TetR/AcrR family transcriptional regulator [Streptomyces sp. DSM 44917]MDT0306189.1 TetR/AcrR family transcriptional regulator [Streptomyces sp. DSM 44917]